MGESHFPRAPTEAANLCKSLKEELKSTEGDSVHNNGDTFKIGKCVRAMKQERGPHRMMVGTVIYLESRK